jgi:radical SAM superfamily enzyme YgiQ (UPF0313 family)
MRKILFIHTAAGILSTKKQPLPFVKELAAGLSFIMGAVRDAGYDYDLLVLSSLNNIKLEIKKALKSTGADIVMTSAVTSQYSFVCKVARQIKRQNNNIKIIIGGVHATLNPQNVIKEDCFDAVCVSDGEISSVKYIEKIRYNLKGAIDNLYIKEDGKIIAPEKICFLEDIDTVKLPERKKWDKYVANINFFRQLHFVIISRGCCYKCTYCSNHAQAKAANGKYIRFRKIENIIEEIKYILNEYPLCSGIYFEAESVSIDLDYFYALCDALEDFKKGFDRKIIFSTQINITDKTATDAVFARFKKAGISTLFAGLESGSAKIRKEVLNRPYYTNDTVVEFCALAKKYDISIIMYVLIGIPWETDEDFRQTVDLLKKTRPDFIAQYIYAPYPGTVLYERLFAAGMIKEYYFKNTGERFKTILAYGFWKKLKIQFNYVAINAKVYGLKKDFIFLFVFSGLFWLSIVRPLLPDFAVRFLVYLGLRSQKKYLRLA